MNQDPTLGDLDQYPVLQGYLMRKVAALTSAPMEKDAYAKILGGIGRSMAGNLVGGKYSFGNAFRHIGHAASGGAKYDRITGAMTQAAKDPSKLNFINRMGAKLEQGGNAAVDFNNRAQTHLQNKILRPMEASGNKWGARAVKAAPAAVGGYILGAPAVLGEDHILSQPANAAQSVWNWTSPAMMAFNAGGGVLNKATDAAYDGAQDASEQTLQQVLQRMRSEGGRGLGAWIAADPDGAYNHIYNKGMHGISDEFARLRPQR